jgi:hypothetical protein
MMKNDKKIPRSYRSWVVGAIIIVFGGIFVTVFLTMKALDFLDWLAVVGAALFTIMSLVASFTLLIKWIRGM